MNTTFSRIWCFDNDFATREVANRLVANAEWRLLTVAKVTSLDVALLCQMGVGGVPGNIDMVRFSFSGLFSKKGMRNNYS